MKGACTAALLLAAMAGQLASGVLRDGMVYDEVAYIPAGYRHLTASDYRLNPETPPLAKLVSALPFLAVPLAGIAPDSSDSSWEWSFRFVHVDNASTPVVALARLPNTLLCLALAAALALWVRSTHGAVAGGAALALCAFHPALLAHGHLATTDLLQAIGICLGSWAFWRWCQRPGLPWAAAVGLGLGIAVSTRLTGWILLPALACLAGVQLAAAPAACRARLARQAAALAGVAPAVAIAVLWLAYGLHYSPWPGASVAHAPHPGLGAAGRLIAALQHSRALPEAYLEALRFQIHDNFIESHDAPGDWPIAYLLVLLVKSTPGFLIALAAAATAAWRQRRALASTGVELHWVVPAAVVFLGASAGKAQTLERYILPVYPYLILLIASQLPALLEGRRGRFWLGIALALHAGPSLAALPSGHLPYTNLSARALDPAHRVLLDSNLDWGQDLPRLAEWMRRSGVRRLQLGYFGSDDPDRYGIDHRDLPGDHLYPARPPRHPFRGTLAVSPNLLFNLHGLPDPQPYAELRSRKPDARAGVFYIFRLAAAAPEDR